MKRIALFPGSFAPFTIGHADIVERGLQMFDSIVIAVTRNINKPDATFASMEQIKAVYQDNPRVEVCANDGLTVDFAREHGAGFILRGVRSSRDFEYERELADINRSLADIETVILPAKPELAFISSSMVRELAAYGKDTSPYLPQPTKR